ncbi:hypothetical protein CLAFUW4_05739 [Fulvia fulva]|uniref:Uncharacterized protein n=1 Tax=Passalora fulva TaxID=5499 RepID=A0A9Q8LGU9_PASFU|nr:uncharacterized protein CLAFUR5_05882 [Fulvia fulva]KAK4624136.1 hypothetical protein CLAFUR4_05733 [Fulvia fulva]KAK4625641.1 hypothetical protein CLAFUR0_05744 [Fulvia fulva]UJO17391.1 hypothetical protein CLAFUR5_05882 [Fulvia fulva]WPV15208.1 hypothetical protein CLAFUW4_05739 [Fulvia fulva]WPV30064.1 hypothetical protein CLAFUW7_05737 [Fulvia fulva]
MATAYLKEILPAVEELSNALTQNEASFPLPLVSKPFISKSIEVLIDQYQRFGHHVYDRFSQDQFGTQAQADLGMADIGVQDALEKVLNVFRS